MMLFLLLVLISYFSMQNEQVDKTLLYQIWGMLLLILLAMFAIRKLFAHIRQQIYLRSPLGKIDQMSGEEFEQFLLAHFEKRFGYSCMQTPGSNDYGADLLLEKKQERVAVQAKRYNGKVGIAAVQEVIAACSYYGCGSGIVVTNSFFTAQAQRLADESDIPVQLWDRDALKKKLRIR